MKKQTKRVLWVFFIVLVMFGSSFAFIIIGVVPEQKPPEIQSPKEFVLEGYLNQTLKEAYISFGYTIMEFHYYENCCQELQFYIDALPGELDNQLVIEKIKDGTGPSILAESRFGKEERNTTDITEVFESLCNILTKLPTDCGLMKLNITAS